MTTETPKSLGQAIDEIINTLQGLEAPSRLTAIRTACEHLGIPYSGGAATPASQAEGIGDATPPNVSFSPSPQQRVLVDIRSLKEQKAPSNSSEMACIVAYYLQYAVPDSEKKTEVSKDEMEKYFLQADFPIPKRPEQILVDAKAAGYFESAGRGSYKLNAVGHNLVVHALPRSGKPVNRLVSRQIARRKTSKKATKKTARSK